MRIPFYQVDAFTNHAFGGNPAAICLLDAWLPDDTLLKIAQENNLSETAFLVPLDDTTEADYHIRWFTISAEFDLCGHATLASAAVIFRDIRPDLETIRFTSMSGPLVVRKVGDLLELDFPARPPIGEVPVTDELVAVLGARPRTVLQSRELHAVFDDPDVILRLVANPAGIAALGISSLGVTAPASDDETDFVCRFFTSDPGIAEDPVTGSIQCTLAPYWAGRLGKDALVAKQLSARGGDLWVRLAGDRVLIAGEAVFVIEGSLILAD